MKTAFRKSGVLILFFSIAFSVVYAGTAMLSYKRDYLADILASSVQDERASAQEFLSFLTYAFVFFLIILILNLWSISEYWADSRRKERNIRVLCGGNHLRITAWMAKEVGVIVLVSFVISQGIRLTASNLNFFLAEYLKEFRVPDILLCIGISVVSFVLIILFLKARHIRGRSFLRNILFFAQIQVVAIAIIYVGFIIGRQMDFAKHFDQVSKNLSVSSYADQTAEDGDVFLGGSAEQYARANEFIENVTGGNYYSFLQSNVFFETIDQKYASRIIQGSVLIEMLYVTPEMQNVFQWSCMEGTLFSAEDFQKKEGYIPVLLGHAFAADYHTGDVIEETYQVRGILDETAFYLHPKLEEAVYYLDQVIIIPMPYTLDQWGGAILNQFTLLTHDSVIEDAIVNQVRELGLPKIAFRNMSDQLESLDAGIRYAIGVYGTVAVIILLLCLVGHISMLLHCIDIKKREYTIRLMCGATMADICVDIILPVEMMVIAAFSVAIAIMGSIANLWIAVVSAVILSMLVLALPLLKLKNTQIAKGLRKLDGI